MTRLQRWRTRSCLTVVCVVLAIASLPSEGRAQARSGEEWRHGTTLAGFGGAASSASTTDFGAGLSLGWEIVPHFGIEGRGIWLGAGDDADAFAATLAAVIPLYPGRPLQPFAVAGAGLYRTTIDAGASDIPSFYSARMPPGGRLSQTFTDFAFAFGGGVDLFVNAHWRLRPEVSVQLATTSSEVYAVAVYGVQLSYHFESHRITP
jgi:outer membrane protein with beta-barrel domain